jgi:hypothetical protein
MKISETHSFPVVPKEFMTERQAAKYCCVGLTHFRSHAGGIALNLWGKKVYRRDDLLALIERHIFPWGRPGAIGLPMAIENAQAAEGASVGARRAARRIELRNERDRLLRLVGVIPKD